MYVEVKQVLDVLVFFPLTSRWTDKINLFEGKRKNLNHAKWNDTEMKHRSREWVQNVRTSAKSFLSKSFRC